MFVTVCVCLQVIEQKRLGYEYVWFTNPVPLASIPTVSTKSFGCCVLSFVALLD